jgi:hypothetical protein
MSDWIGVKLGLQDPAPAEDPAKLPEVWCYRTIGKPDCYATPQPDMQDRLIAVQPYEKFPNTAEDYRKLQGEGQKPLEKPVVPAVGAAAPH